MLTFTINIPENIDVFYKYNMLYINNKKSKIKKYNNFILLSNVFVYKKENKLFLTLKTLLNKKDYALHVKVINLYYKLIINKIMGVSGGFFSQVECVGLGYKAKVSNSLLILNVNFSHKISIKIPKEVIVFCSRINNIVFFSTDRQKLFEFVHLVRSYKKPDSYKGKGLRLKGEILKLKEGKKI